MEVDTEEERISTDHPQWLSLSLSLSLSPDVLEGIS